MPNVVEIIVRSKNETKTGFDAARVDAAKLGDDVGKTFSERFAERVINMRTTIKESVNRSGTDIGDSMGDTIHRRITEKIRAVFSGREKIHVDTDVNIDKDKDTLRTKAEGLGKDIGDKLSDGIGGSLTSFFSGDVLSLIIKVLAGGSVVAALAGPIAAAISAGVLLALGGGVIGLGIAAALKDPRIQGALGDLKKKIGDLFAKFGEPFKGPVADVLEKFTRFIESKQVGIFFDQMGKVFAPIVGALGSGFISLLQNALPGIQDAAEAAAPLFKTLADHLPKIGQALGDLFRDISDNGDEANQFFDDLLTVIEHVIVWVGKLLKAFGTWYRGTRAWVMLAIAVWEALSDKVGKVFRDIGDILGGAVSLVRSVVRKIQGFIDGLHGKSITIGFRTAGLGAIQAAAAIANHFGANAAGGVVGAATGGLHRGLRWVGEQGPELVNLPASATVHSAADSQRMMRQMQGDGGGVGTIIVQLVADGKVLAETIVEPLRENIRTKGRGKAQTYLGQAGVAA